MKKIIAILLIGLWFCFVSARAEDFLTLTGEKITYQELVQRPKVVLFAWAVWCPYCRQELERVSQECEYFGDAEVFFINIGDKTPQVEKYAESKKFKPCIREKIILDQKVFIARKFNIIGIPTYIFLKNGELVKTTHFFNQEMLTSIFGKD